MTLFNMNLLFKIFFTEFVLKSQQFGQFMCGCAFELIICY